MSVVVKQISKCGRFVVEYNSDNEDVILYEPSTGRSAVSSRGCAVFFDGLAVAVDANKLNAPGWLYEPAGVRVAPESELRSNSHWVVKETSKSGKYAAAFEPNRNRVAVYNRIDGWLSKPGKLFSVMDDILVINAVAFDSPNWLFKLDQVGASTNDKRCKTSQPQRSARSNAKRRRG